MAQERTLWTVGQAAEVLGCSEDTVRRLIAAGTLPSVNVSVRLTRVDPIDVYTYIEARKRKVSALQRKTRGKGPAPRRGGVNNSGYYPGMKVV